VRASGTGRSLLSRALPVIFAARLAVAHAVRRVGKLLQGEPGKRAVQKFATADPARFHKPSIELPSDLRVHGIVNLRYRRFASKRFKGWCLKVDGLVQAPMELSLDLLRGIRSRSHVSRRDCMEGDSAIDEWRGVLLSDVLAIVAPLPNARCVVFHCAHPADHAQTSRVERLDLEAPGALEGILAFDLNGKPLTVGDGAPLQLRIERPPSYEIVKYVMRIELVDNLRGFDRVNGSYWEDLGGE
jgi:DMSO/TMAO reductase YedYZ molybdopterin-dependent catalytic subunit